MRAPKKKRSGKSTEGPAGPGPNLDETDLALLSSLCDSVHLDEMSFDSWETCLRQLDLTVPFFLATAAAAQGGDLQVNFCRTTRATATDRPVRTPVSCLVHVPPGATDGQQVRVKGQGDQVADQAGDLIVTLHLKP